MPLQISLDGHQTVAHFDENLTTTTAPAVRDALKALIADGVQQLRLDMEQVTVVDSPGIGLLVATHNSLVRLGGALTITNASPDLLELFKAFRLDKHFRILGKPSAE